MHNDNEWRFSEEGIVWARYLERLLHSISVIADADYQQRVWIEHDPSRFSWYTEEMSRIFDDVDIDRIVESEWKRLGLSESQRDQLDCFRRELNTFDERHPGLPDNEEIVADPEWPRIRTVAARTLAAFGLEPKVRE